MTMPHPVRPELPPRLPAATPGGPPTPPDGGRSSLDAWPPYSGRRRLSRRLSGVGPHNRMNWTSIVLPSARRPRLLVPSARRASAAAVRRYGEPGSSKAWAGSRMLALALAGVQGPSASVDDCGFAFPRASTRLRPT